MKRIRKYIKPISLFIALTFLSELIGPTAVYAITGHSSMPEYRSFEPVSTDNMVNHFDGSFIYNLPLLDVPNGYPINLTYHSNEINNEALASWVGLGWNINPGAINRMKRGFPDEFKGKSVKYHNRMPSNWTISAGVSAQPEIFGSESLISLNIGTSVRYNNYNGLGTSITGGIGFAGVVNMNFSYSNGRFGFNPEVNPFAVLNVRDKIADKKKIESSEKALSEDLQSKGMKAKDAKRAARAITSSEIKQAKAKQKGSTQVGFSVGGIGGSTNGKLKGTQMTLSLVPERNYPINVSQYSGFMVNLKFDIGVNVPCFPIDFEATGHGSFSSQTNVEEADMDVYGYKYNELATDDDEAMMDYFTENEKMLEKRETMIGYPLPNNDSYSISGELMGGGFRPYRPEFGHYRKNKVKSEDFSINVGADVNIASTVPSIPPPPIGIVDLVYTYGGELGGDYHYMQVSDWDDMAKNSDFRFRGDDDYEISNEKYFYLYGGDKAGYFDMTNFDHNAFSAGLVKTFEVWADADLSAWTNPTWVDYRYKGRDKKRSTYVAERLNSDFGATAAGGVKYKVLEKNLHIYDETGSVISYDHSLNPADGVGEFVTYNADGMTYVYGLPVHARNEKELQYSLKSSEINLTYLNDPSQGGGQLTQVTGGGIDASAKRKLGYEANSTDKNAYATTHLITQVLSPDYVDRKGDGPTKDDFGDFTKFNYQRVAGGSSWYSYRTPYSGVSFSYGSLSSHADDMGSFSYGEKEVYFLQSVVSKTHVAIFTLGNRNDGKSTTLDGNSSADQLLTGNGSASVKQLKKLERIDLYSIEDCQIAGGGGSDIGMWEPVSGARPIKTVHFDYDYSLCNGVLNGTSGKLTLKRVWFEYGGKVTNKLSPYVFKYNYSTATYPSPYNSDVFNAVSNPDGIQSYGNLSSVYQNPDYKIINTDRWGNYRDYPTMMGTSTYGMGELARFWPYVHQNPDPSKFDPAAWCLKQIVLPSGGEIHIQYEQNDYQYVQDQRAMMMVPLGSPTSTDEKNAAINDKKYYVDLSKIGINYGSLSNGARDTLAEDMFYPMMVNKQRLFFNFLYALVGNDVNYQYTHSDYLEGYARINGYGHDANGIYFTFKGGSGGNFHTISYPNQASKRELPRKVCLDFYKTQRRLKIDGGQNTTAVEDAGNGGNPGEDLIYAFVNIAGRIMDDIAVNCKKFDPEMSYVRLRVPVTEAVVKKKLGGGVRVKRLLMYDRGIMHDDPSLYGSEYEYNTKLVEGDPNSPIISSGVATNEPPNGRRESPLVNPIDKSEQSKWNAIAYGRDMYSQEGPIGESLLPGASIGYSRVTVRPIHKGKTGTGKEVRKFYTVKEYPFEAERTTVEEVLVQPLTASVNTGVVGLSYTRQTPHMAQGFAFRTYSMHGKPHWTAKFAQNSEINPVAIEYYEYYGLNDQVRVMNNDMTISTIPFKQMGTQVEILSEAREVQDYSMGGQVAADLTGGTLTFMIPFSPPIVVTIPVPIPTGFNGSAYLNEHVYRTHVTSKIIEYPSMLKRVINKTNGIQYITENLVFDDNTGEPVVTQSYDDFTGVYTDQTFKSSWEYPNMRSKFQNEDKFVKPSPGGQFAYGSYTSGGSLKEYLTFTASGGASDCGALALFTKGDFIQIHSSGGVGRALYHVDEVDFANDRLMIAESQHSTSTAIGTINKLEIIRSGFTNQLNSNAANIVYFSQSGSPAIFTGSNALTQSHAFVNALNNAILPLSSSNPSVTLNGTFTGISVANFAASLPGQCSDIDLNNAQIKDVELDIQISAGNQMNIKVKSFYIYCDGDYHQVICY